MEQDSNPNSHPNPSFRLWLEMQCDGAVAKEGGSVSFVRHQWAPQVLKEIMTMGSGLEDRELGFRS